MELQLNESTQTITGTTKNIEGLQFLKNFQGELVEIDVVNMDGTCTAPTRFITDLTVILSKKYISLDSSTEDIGTIRLPKEIIFDIEEEYTEKLLIHTIKGDIIINRL